ncbi:hypothetical protein [Falsiphaeobacter marinintestinus]|uniref:hypothetical protein n=1 Tax=Falsiphaeobacter marinintestinus TaxID=1492905 RepID=UPI0016444BBA|nr:hypothetical protein [Phaeobacter marinintestinus]
MKTKIWTPLIITAAALASCDTTENGDPHQSRESFELSKEVELTNKGKTYSNMVAYPTTFTISSPDNNDANARNTNLPCALSSDTFTATITTPAKLNLPTYGQSTPPVMIKCIDGEREIEKTVKVTNLTQLSYSGETASALLFTGVVGIALTQAQASQRDKTKDIYGYPPQVSLQ